jgi:hypothetical protein
VHEKSNNKNTKNIDSSETAAIVHPNDTEDPTAYLL